jgi:uncharacterized membrane-anchored protein
MIVLGRALGAICLGLFIIAAAPAATPDPTIAAIRAMHWSSSPQDLSASQSNVVPPAHVRMIRGDEARTFDKLINGQADAATEAIASDPRTGDVVYLQFSDAGYVTVDDWTKVDSGQLLQSIRDNTETSNADRKASGVAAIHVLDWVQKPAFDPTTKTVRWAISAKSDDSPAPIVNSIAIKLGRHGYEKFTWVTAKETYVAKGGMLDQIVAAQSFNQGARYQDYVTGDKLAGYGIAALVGTVAGATLVKTGALLAILLFMKKLWFLGVAGILAAWRWIAGKTKQAKFGPPPATPPA